MLWIRTINGKNNYFWPSLHTITTFKVVLGCHLLRRFTDDLTGNHYVGIQMGERSVLGLDIVPKG